MKKLLATILAIAFVFGLTACGGNSDGEISVFYYNFVFHF